MRRIYMPPGTSGAATAQADLLTPAVEIEIFGQLGYFGPSASGGAWADPNQSLIAVSTDTSRDNAQRNGRTTGQAQITLTAGVWGMPGEMSWLDLIYPQDLVVISFARTENYFRTAFIGYVEEVAESATAPAAGSAQRQVVINAFHLSDALSHGTLFLPSRQVKAGTGDQPVLGITGIKTPSSASSSGIAWSKLFKALMTASITTLNSTTASAWLAIWLEQIRKQDVATTSLPSEELIRILFQYLTPVIYAPQSVVHGTRYSYADYFTLALAQTQYQYMALSLQPPSGDFWTLVMQAANPPFFELFMDIRSADEFEQEVATVGSVYYGSPAGTNPPSFGHDRASPVLFFRRKPFYSEEWNQLIRHDIPSSDIVAYTRGRQLQDVVNYYCVYPEGFAALNQPAINRQFPAIIDVDSAIEYGLTPMNIPIYGLTQLPAPNKGASSLDAMMPYNYTLFDWYSQNPYYLNYAPLSVVGDPKYRLGQRARIMTGQYGLAAPTEGYITRVQHQFVMFDHYTTSLETTRGAPEGSVISAQAAAAQRGVKTVWDVATADLGVAP